MKKLFVFAASTLAIACNNSENGNVEGNQNETISAMKTTLSDEEVKDGWQLLFDGNSTSGWHIYGGEGDGSGWKALDGTLKLDASNKIDGKIAGGGNLVTNEEFENFDLKLEWKIDTGGNSGIIFYVNEDTTKYKKPYETGPEMQVLDNERHGDAKYPKHRAGDLYDLISCSTETVKPALEWNEVEIKSDNGKLDFWLNGVNVVSTQMWDENWNKMIAESKFKQWPGFGTFKKGKICLQDHESTVWFRNIKIKRL